MVRAVPLPMALPSATDMARIIREAGEYRGRAEAAERELGRVSSQLEAVQGRLHEREHQLGLERTARRSAEEEAARLRAEAEQLADEAADCVRRQAEQEQAEQAGRHQEEVAELRRQLTAARAEADAAVELAAAEEEARGVAEEALAEAEQGRREAEERAREVGSARLAEESADLEAALGVGAMGKVRRARRGR
ncbi:hypothetical protein [Streptomyces triticirhizae]|uniref:Uncharacterized protein n=1 Tax=Streptomyces triticirhizae TaxID=2483353 RepID=A0A3M2M496_9ACTN|nr:hypothetical protein [Streptomyces triticirhizae]RMI44429.1 hypothetical protein EBN88_05360 [Streptomyces triticirhizae]